MLIALLAAPTADADAHDNNGTGALCLVTSRLVSSSPFTQSEASGKMQTSRHGAIITNAVAWSTTRSSIVENGSCRSDVFGNVTMQ
jgi:hypothetical protein